MPPTYLPGHPVEAPSDPSDPLHSRDRFVSQARLRTLLKLVAGVRFSSSPSEVQYLGDDRAGGHVLHDGCGNHLAMAWNEHGVVALAFDHEMSHREEDRRHPDRYVADAPAVLGPLIPQAVAFAGGVASGGLWITAGPDPQWECGGNGTERLDGYALTAEEAVFGAQLPQNWRELELDDDARARLAMRLAEASSRGPVVIGPDDEAILLAVGEHVGRPPEPAAAEEVARRLAELGITWNDAVGALVRATVERQRAAREALGALQVELLQAAQAGDLAGVRDALARGADIECVACEGIFTDSLAQSLTRHGDLTALALAAGNGDLAMVEVLLEAGANPGARKAELALPTALGRALKKGDAPMIRRLVAAGPDFSADGAAHAYLMPVRPEPADVRIVRMLLDRGATRFNGAMRSRIVAAAEAAGDQELAARFRGPAR